MWSFFCPLYNVYNYYYVEPCKQNAALYIYIHAWNEFQS